MSRLKQPQVLKIDPETELKFRGPFTDVVTSSLSLTNPTDKRVCFKVKTTAPRRYCVRPNSGFVEANGSVNVSVMLQPFDSDPAELGKHKFMVQTMYAPEVVENIDELWRSTPASELMDSKLRCMFELPEDDQVPPPTTTTQSENEPPATGKSGGSTELTAIMEECKRLQAENSKLKQQNEKLMSTNPTAGATVDADQQKRMLIIFVLIAFAIGLSLGYILS